VRRLLPAAGPRTVILGITPHAFTPNAINNNAFDALAGYTENELRARIATARYDRCFASFVTMTKPVSSAYTQYEMINSGDGFTACRVSPCVPGMAVLDYNGYFAKGKVQSSAVSELLETVRQWTADGITVYAVRPPVSRELRAVEDSGSGFNEASFRRAFATAGGQWLDIPGSYTTYDGSHLIEQSALRYSRVVAAAIR
jgi:hypothetical protein